MTQTLRFRYTNKLHQCKTYSTLELNIF